MQFPLKAAHSYCKYFITNRTVIVFTQCYTYLFCTRDNCNVTGYAQYVMRKTSLICFTLQVTVNKKKKYFLIAESQLLAHWVRRA